MKHNVDIIDKAAWALSGALMLLGIVVFGIVEILAGPPYGAAPMTNDAGEIIATPMIDPALRTGLVLLGLFVLFAWGVFRMIRTPDAEMEEETATVSA
jgi:hypothetical protein